MNQSHPRGRSPCRRILRERIRIVSYFYSRCIRLVSKPGSALFDLLTSQIEDEQPSVELAAEVWGRRAQVGHRHARSTSRRQHGLPIKSGAKMGGWSGVGYGVAGPTRRKDYWANVSHNGGPAWHFSTGQRPVAPEGGSPWRSHSRGLTGVAGFTD